MNIFYALAEPTRLNIFELLAANNELSVLQITSRFKITSAAISQHLKVLKESKLVVMEKKAQQHLYRINPQALFEIESWAKRINRMWENSEFASQKLVDRELQKPHTY